MREILTTSPNACRPSARHGCPVRSRSYPSITRSVTPCTEPATPPAARKRALRSSIRPGSAPESRSTVPWFPKTRPVCRTRPLWASPAARSRAPVPSSCRDRRPPHEVHRRAESSVAARDVRIAPAPSQGILDLAVDCDPNPATPDPTGSRNSCPVPVTSRVPHTSVRFPTVARPH